MKRSFLVSHRAHDYAFLIQRWRAVAARAGLIMRPFAVESGLRIYCVRSRRMPAEGGIYISAGIHGDEPAATEALITWAEKNVRTLSRLPFLIIPCINPWGLINNSRFNADGRDLNRVFHHDEIPVIGNLKMLLQSHCFALGLTLHEDYDGQGIYIYEIENVTPFWGEDLLKIATPFLPIEGRTLIDGRPSTGSGLVRRKIKLRTFKKIGLPEAVYLHLHHVERVFTIETPSEFALDDRVRAHLAILDECVQRIVKIPTSNEAISACAKAAKKESSERPKRK
jgi:protein MpaA